MTMTKSRLLYNELKSRCQTGYYPAGGQLPKEVDLAMELGVSRKTLRLALDQLAKENLIARLKGQGTFIQRETGPKNKILVILNPNQDMSNPYPYIMPGIQEAALTANIRIETCMPDSFLALSDIEAVQNIRGNAPDGIILMANCFNGNERLLKVLQQTGIPTLLPHAAESDHRITGFATQSMDYRQIIMDGLSYLKAQGHTRIAIMTGAGRGIAAAEYRQWARQAGVGGYLSEVPYDYEAVSAWLDRLLALDLPPTAIFCYSDFFAIHVYRHLKQKNIKIPEELSILSVGGHIGCNYLTPTLSAVDFNLHEIGQSALTLLLDIIYGKKYSPGIMPKVISPHHIAERQSTRFVIKNNQKENKELVFV